MIKHRHHIIPKHMGGSNDPTNLVDLTIEEHAEAHRILFEEYGRWQDDLAYRALSGIIGKEDIIKEAQTIGGKIGSKTSGDRYKDRVRKMGLSNKGKKHSAEEKLAKSVRQRGKKISQEHKEKISKSHCKNLYEITHPSGKVEIIDNLQKFCLNHDLVRRNMCAVVSGKEKTHRGFAGRFVKTNNEE